MLIKRVTGALFDRRARGAAGRISRGVERAGAALALVAFAFSSVTVLPQPLAEARPGEAEETVAWETEAGDGTILRGHITFPDAKAPHATILELSPYFNTRAGGRTEQGPTSGAQREYLEADFAIAQVNMRGTGLSDGCLQFGNKVDWQDAHAVIESLAAESWSNGKIGMIGHSYSGWSQYMAVAGAPPALKAIVPTSGVSDPWELLTRRGAPIHYGPVLAPVWTALTGWAADDSNAEHVCPDLYAEHVQGTADLIATGDRTPYWAKRNLRPRIKNTNVAVWRSNGLNYWGEGHWHSYDQEWDVLRRDRTRFILGQWSHSTPAGSREDWYERTIAWFDHYLRGGPRKVKPGVVEFQDTAGTWHSADSWPPKAKEVELHLSEMSLVTKAKDVQDSEQSFATAAGIEPGLACGPHQAFYVSPPIKKDVVLAGYFDADLTVTSSQPGGNLVAVLRHLPGEFPCGVDGSDFLALFGAGAKTAVGRVQMDLRHWKTPGEHRAFPVIEPTRVRAPSGPFAAFVPAGHRLVLFIAGGSAELEPDQFQPTLTISTGKEVAGSIRIPVVKGDLKWGE